MIKELNLSLTDSFKLRTLIKRKIGIVNQDIVNLPISYDKEVEGKKVELVINKYGNLDQMIDLCLNLQETLGELNKKIDENNIVVRPLLDQIESLTAQNSLLGKIVSLVENRTKLVEKEFNTVTGKYDVTELAQTYSLEKVKQLTELYKSKTREIHQLEEEISSLNGKTCFNFEISQEIYDFIYDL